MSRESSRFVLTPRGWLFAAGGAPYAKLGLGKSAFGCSRPCSHAGRNEGSMQVALPIARARHGEAGKCDAALCSMMRDRASVGGLNTRLRRLFGARRFDCIGPFVGLNLTLKDKIMTRIHEARVQHEPHTPIGRCTNGGTVVAPAGS